MVGLSKTNNQMSTTNHVQGAETPQIALYVSGLVETIKEAVKSEIQAQMEALRPTLSETQDKQDADSPEFITRVQACKMLHVSQTTLTTWRRKNVLLPHKIGGRTLYKRADIERAIKGQRGERTSKAKKGGN